MRRRRWGRRRDPPPSGSRRLDGALEHRPALPISLSLVSQPTQKPAPWNSELISPAILPYRSLISSLPTHPGKCGVPVADPRKESWTSTCLFGPSWGAPQLPRSPPSSSHTRLGLDKSLYLLPGPPMLSPQCLFSNGINFNLFIFLREKCLLDLWCWMS